MGQDARSQAEETQEPILTHNIKKDPFRLRSVAYIDIEPKQEFIGLCNKDVYYLLVPLVGDGQASRLLAKHILSGLNEYFKQQSE